METAVRYRGKLNLPQETIDAMNESLRGELPSVNTVEELMTALNAED